MTAGDAKKDKWNAFLMCMPECFDRDVSSFGEAEFEICGSLSQYIIYMIIAKEGLRLLAWLYFFTGGISARKTSLFKYILYSPGTIFFHRLPAVQQMIVETTRAVENGNEAPWLKVRATCGLVGQGIKLWRTRVCA